jgi:hypothetical protein
MRRWPLLLLLCTSVSAGALRAQPVPAAAGGRAGALGQPSAWNWTGHVAGGRADGARGEAALGLQWDVLNPLLGMAALHGELYGAADAAGAGPGVRARVVNPLLRIGAGVDYQPGVHHPAVVLSVAHPLRRGGLFADGSMLRLDYVPARDGAFTLGIEKPLLRSTRAGRSRPRTDHARLPAERLHARLRATRAGSLAGPGGEASSAGAAPADDHVHRTARRYLADAAVAARHVRLFTLPLGPIPATHPTDEGRVRAEVAPVRGVDAGDAVLRFHDALDSAFAAAFRSSTAEAPRSEGRPAIAGGDTAAPAAAAGEPATGPAAAAAARAALLEHVLLPYNRLLGQERRPDRIEGLGVRAFGAYEDWLRAESGLDASQRTAALHVFVALLDIVEENRAALRAQWRDSRFVWLPLQYALRPEQHATQEALDALVERAVGVRFSDGNFVSYVVNEQYQYHLYRTIRDARSYHVLWTHDFRGLDAGGEPDEMAYRHVLTSYLGTLTERVREYDATGSLPTYMIVLDQWFYEVNRGRLWLSLLEDPLRHRVRLPPQYAAWQEAIAEAQQALRDAVAASSRLQSQAGRYGEDWLHDLVRVHVSITNPADPSFWSTGVVRGLPLPDNMMRDHRKVVFYDITEDDPYAGAALFTGAGIGEHYANLSWEDRSLLVRGPALLPLKATLRDLLVHQGLPRDRVPNALLPRPLHGGYDDMVRAATQRYQQPLRALLVHNEAGFGAKDVNVAKAVLYTLMPAGSVLKIPDSLWSSDFWGSLLLGCALRGGRVLVIAPADGNAPAVAFGALGRSREMLTRLLIAEQELAPDIERAGGLLRVGMYRTGLKVNDIPGKVAAVVRAFDEQSWLRTLFGFRHDVLEEVREIADGARGVNMDAVGLFEFEHDTLPKLHFKANYFASAEAWTLMQRPEWAITAWSYMQQRMDQLQGRTAAVRTFRDGAEPIADAGGGMVLSWFDGLDEDVRERVVFYTLMGSHNQNSRSIAIDAEVGFLLSQWPAIIPYIDLVVVIGQTHWIREPAELAEYLPLDSGPRRRLVHWFRLAI